MMNGCFIINACIEKLHNKSQQIHKDLPSSCSFAFRWQCFRMPDSRPSKHVSSSSATRWSHSLFISASVFCWFHVSSVNSNSVLKSSFSATQCCRRSCAARIKPYHSVITLHNVTELIRWVISQHAWKHYQSVITLHNVTELIRWVISQHAWKHYHSVITLHNVTELIRWVISQHAWKHKSNAVIHCMRVICIHHNYSHCKTNESSTV